MSRAPKQLKRKQSFRNGDRLLVLTEGKKTEPDYFKQLLSMLKISPEQVVVQAGTSSDPKRLVEEAKALSYENARDFRKGIDAKFDDIRLVFDSEDDRPNLREAINQAVDNEFIVALSAPSIEYWFLLHYQLTTKLMNNADEVTRELKKYQPDYDKLFRVDPNDFERLVNNALKNAESIRKTQDSHMERIVYPSTTVDVLVRRIMGLKRY
jgi:hypothetical protein